MRNYQFKFMTKPSDSESEQLQECKYAVLQAFDAIEDVFLNSLDVRNHIQNQFYIDYQKLEKRIEKLEYEVNVLTKEVIKLTEDRTTLLNYIIELTAPFDID